MVTSQERPDNSPLQSIHTNLDSFILYNDEIPNEQELFNETSPNLVFPPHPNIVASIDEEENKEKTESKFANSENYSKQITVLEVQNSHKNSADHENQRIKPQNIENLEEQNKINIVQTCKNNTVTNYANKTERTTMK